MEDMTEEDILKFWEEKEIYKKSKKKNSKGEKFYMMDGPPYATGSIHLGTALNKISKDIAMRAQRLQGKDVFDRTGYDTHGVPIEFKVEKEIGAKTKQDIEEFGVKKFIEKCKEYATKFIELMGPEFRNLGVWMDFDNPYLTLDNTYVETIWDTFKEADRKGLLYLGKYPVHICPRCETAVSFNEIEYAKQKDISRHFPVCKIPAERKRKHLSDNLDNNSLDATREYWDNGQSEYKLSADRTLLGRKLDYRKRACFKNHGQTQNGLYNKKRIQGKGNARMEI